MIEYGKKYEKIFMIDGLGDTELLCRQILHLMLTSGIDLQTF